MEQHNTPPSPSFAEAWRYWGHLGCVSFGGPAAQIGLMHQALVIEKRWISERRFLHALNYCMLLPGPEAQQLAIYLGWLFHGRWGGLVAGVLFVLPAFVLLVGLSFLYMQFGHLLLVSAFLYGIKPLVVALVMLAAWRLGHRVLKNRWLWGLAVFSLVAQSAGLPFPVLIFVAALIGWSLHQWRPALLAVSTHYSDAAVSAKQRYVIDDDTPSPSMRQGWRAFSGLLLAALVLGLGVWLCLCTVFGRASVYPLLGLFFGKAALLTFGGAYAVLPYVFEASVRDYHWLTTAQMLDGLALGESTPGPLVMIVTYIGFVAGWTHASLNGALSPWSAAVLGASVATWFTFLPGFLMIFAGAPWIEHSRQQQQWHAPLTAISAAVVGVIVHLALQLWRPVCWPHGIDPWACGLIVLAWLLLLRTRLPVFYWVPVFALLGALIQFGGVV